MINIDSKVVSKHLNDLIDEANLLEDMVDSEVENESENALTLVADIKDAMITALDKKCQMMADESVKNNNDLKMSKSTWSGAIRYDKNQYSMVQTIQPVTVNIPYSKEEIYMAEDHGLRSLAKVGKYGVATNIISNHHTYHVKLIFSDNTSRKLPASTHLITTRKMDQLMSMVLNLKHYKFRIKQKINEIPECFGNVTMQIDSDDVLFFNKMKERFSEYREALKGLS